VLILIIISFSCSPAYYKKVSGTPIPTEAAMTPDYSQMNFWASHPLKHDPADSISTGINDAFRDSAVDVFFLHPTTFTDEKRIDELNASLGDDTLNAKTDYSSILYQASVFNAGCKDGRPRYRQAHLGCIFIRHIKSRRHLNWLCDEKAEYYQRIRRPIIIASHAGTTHAKRLIKEFFDGQTKNRLVVAYLVGIYVDKNQFETIPVCADSLQTGCFVSWRTFRRDYEGPEYISLEPHSAAVVNPLTWSIDTTFAPKQLNKGAVLYKYNKVFPHPNDAQVKGNILWISRPKISGPHCTKRELTRRYKTSFYMNIRQDIKDYHCLK
jgi:hypothetical protein